MALYPDLYGDLYQPNGNGTPVANPQFPQDEWKRQLEAERRQAKQAALKPHTPAASQAQTPGPLEQVSAPSAPSRFDTTPTSIAEANRQRILAQQVQGTTLSESALQTRVAVQDETEPDINEPLQIEENNNEEPEQIQEVVENESLGNQGAQPRLAAVTAAQSLVGQSTQRLATTNFLRSAWFTLIPSFGLTLIYIDIHFIAAYLFGSKLFCRLGQEWIPVNTGVETLNRGAEIIELIVLAIVNALIALLILLIVMLIISAVVIVKKSASLIPGL